MASLLDAGWSEQPQQSHERQALLGGSGQSLQPDDASLLVDKADSDRAPDSTDLLIKRSSARNDASDAQADKQQAQAQSQSQRPQAELGFYLVICVVGFVQVFAPRHTVA